MALTQIPRVGDKVRHIDGSHVYDISRYDEWGNAVITLPDLGDCGLIMEEDFEEFELISEGADDMSKPATRAEYWADKRREIEGATYTAEQRQARKGERIVIVEPCEHDSEDYERGDVFTVDKVDSAGVVTTTGNIVYHEEYEVLPEGVTDLFHTNDGEDLLDAEELCGFLNGDNVEKPSHYTQGKFETIDIIAHIVAGYDDPFVGHCVGTAVKYVSRAPYKHDTPLEDMRKAKRYIEFAIERLEGER